MPKKAKKAAAGAPAWMTTFADMVTLLLTFFVLLLSMANMDKVKFSEASGSLKGAFGVMMSSTSTEVAPPRIVDFSPMDDDLTARLYQRIASTTHRMRLDKDIEVVKDRGAVILRVNASVLFDSGEVAVKEKAYPILEKVAQMVQPLPLNIRIEGHTDSRPIYGRDLTNWDLSVQRAVSVLRVFAQRSKLPLRRMSAAGYGAEKPLAPNDTEENQALNRRVEFVLESSTGQSEDLPYLVDTQDQSPF